MTILCPAGTDLPGIEEDRSASVEIAEAEKEEADKSTREVIAAVLEAACKPFRSFRKVEPCFTNALSYKHNNHVCSNPQVQDFKVIKVEDTLHPTRKKTLDLNSLRLTEGLNYTSGVLKPNHFKYCGTIMS